ncbi:MAG: FtsX-like permease family protein [Planctomycetaceae bacterium]|nr:FtsX-like permease family protein [Planctomycetaceae bacterium]
MSVWRLMLREILHRKLNFGLGVLSVAIAIACLVGAQSLLQADRVITQHILSERQAEVETAVAEKQAEVEKAGAELQDAMRKHMLGLGFNVLILPEGQDLSELHLNGSLSATMPEHYVTQLAESKIVTVNHLLPSVTRRIHWDERDMDIILVGTRGEVPIMHRAMKKPLLDAVAPGKMVVGYEVHLKLGLKEGDKVTLMGKEFTVSTLHPQRGSQDDTTVWIDLAQAQEMLGLQNLIHAILALECDCAGDRISVIRQEIAGILPGTQVIERYSQALARAEARGYAKQSAEEALEREKQAGQELLDQTVTSREEIETRHAGLASVLVPLVIGASALLIGLLSYVNTRQRREEIGILRAIGLRAQQIMLVLLSKAVMMGLIGGVLGVVLGLGVLAFGGTGVNLPVPVSEVIRSSPVMSALVTAMVLAPVLASLASWLPGLIAARQDPAVVLQGD